MSTVAVSYPVARKAHRCGSCNGPIASGEPYRRWTGTNEAWFGLATLKECGECCERYGRPLTALSVCEWDAKPHRDCEGPGKRPAFCNQQEARPHA